MLSLMAYFESMSCRELMKALSSRNLRGLKQLTTVEMILKKHLFIRTLRFDKLKYLYSKHLNILEEFNLNFNNEKFLWSYHSSDVLISRRVGVHTILGKKCRVLTSIIRANISHIRGWRAASSIVASGCSEAPSLVVSGCRAGCRLAPSLFASGRRAAPSMIASACRSAPSLVVSQAQQSLV